MSNLPFPLTNEALRRHGINPDHVPQDGLHHSHYDVFGLDAFGAPRRSGDGETVRRSVPWPSDYARDDILSAFNADGGHVSGSHDMVNHPPHYTSHPSGIEAIQVTEHMGFCLGNAIKYIWRADLKHDAIEDLRKAIWYVEREISRRQHTTHSPVDGSVEGSRGRLEDPHYPGRKA